MNFQVLWRLLQSDWYMKYLKKDAGEEQSFLYQNNTLTKKISYKVAVMCTSCYLIAFIMIDA